MDVTKAVAQRSSVRAFKTDVPSAAVVRGILESAARAPSGGNLQPWKVYALTGAPLAELKAQVAANPMGETPEYEVYPANLWDPFRTRRFQNGEELYASIKLGRDDKPARLRQLANCSVRRWACSSAWIASSARRNGRTWVCICRRLCCWRWSRV